ncbi:MAG: ribonuclease [Oscillospiraceae bacterium]|nr:ribonuclease [Oscillospiraceae bacterium]
MKKRILALLLALLTALSLFACGKKPQAPAAEPDPPIQQGQTVEVTDPIVADDPTDTPATQEDPTLDESGTYTSKEDVALYIHLYGHLPDNFITKKEAQAMGWTGGSLEPYAPGKCIGGSRFGNYEGALPDAPGRKYTECDIDTLGAKGRGAKRIVFSNDGLIYYTEDHYKTFELLYGEGEG